MFVRVSPIMYANSQIRRRPEAEIEILVVYRGAVALFKRCNLTVRVTYTPRQYFEYIVVRVNVKINHMKGFLCVNSHWFLNCCSYYLREEFFTAVIKLTNCSFDIFIEAVILFLLIL